MIEVWWWSIFFFRIYLFRESVCGVGGRTEGETLSNGFPGSPLSTELDLMTLRL